MKIVEQFWGILTCNLLQYDVSSDTGAEEVYYIVDFGVNYYPVGILFVVLRDVCTIQVVVVGGFWQLFCAIRVGEELED